MSCGSLPDVSLESRLAALDAELAAVPGVLVENIATTAKTLPDFPGLWAAMLAGRAP